MNATNERHRAWLATVFSKPDQLFGLQVGGSTYHDRITLASGREFEEQIVSGHVVWQKEALSEVSQDNIYTNKKTPSEIEGSPVDKDDSVLLPADD